MSDRNIEAVLLFPEQAKKPGEVTALQKRDSLYTRNDMRAGVLRVMHIGFAVKCSIT